MGVRFEMMIRSLVSCQELSVLISFFTLSHPPGWLIHVCKHHQSIYLYSNLKKIQFRWAKKPISRRKKKFLLLLRNGYDYHHHNHQSHSKNLYVFPYFGKEQQTFVTFVFVLLAFLVCCSFRHHKNRTIKIGRNHAQLSMIYGELFFFLTGTEFIAGLRKRNKKENTYWSFLFFFLLSTGICLPYSMFFFFFCRIIASMPGVCGRSVCWTLFLFPKWYRHTVKKAEY